MDGEITYSFDTFSDEDAALDYPKLDLDILVEISDVDEAAEAELEKRRERGEAPP